MTSYAQLHEELMLQQIEALPKEVLDNVSAIEIDRLALAVSTAVGRLQELADESGDKIHTTLNHAIKRVADYPERAFHAISHLEDLSIHLKMAKKALRCACVLLSNPEYRGPNEPNPPELTDPKLKYYLFHDA